MDPSWISVALTLLGIIVTGVVSYQAGLRGTQVALAVMHERYSALKDQVVRLTETVDELSEGHGEHTVRIDRLERGGRMPPLDYVR